ncbi:MAG TPA: hypothetical protein VGD37_12710 [Kofleriaceae bacterium]|jgi:hypothetical protein
MSSKAFVADTVELLVEIPSDFSDEVIPRGTRGTVVKCYQEPKEATNARFPRLWAAGAERQVRGVRRGA